MQGIKLRTIADAVGTQSDDKTPEELYIVNPPAKRQPISGKWILDPIAAAEAAAAAAAEEGTEDSEAGSPARAAAAARKRRAEAQGDEEDEAGGGGGAKGGEKFPTHEEMRLLPQEIQATLMELVMEYFRRKIYPRLVFLARRKHVRASVAQARVSAPLVSAGFITSVPLFARWPGIEGVARTMRLLVVERGHLLTHEGETNPIGAFFLVQGTMQARKRRPASQMNPISGHAPGIVRGVNGKPVSRKSLGPNNTTISGTFEAPMCYGEMTLLTEEPRMESLRAVTRCLVWVFDRASFFNQLNNLPAMHRAGVTEVAFQQRRENIPRVFPVTGAALAKVHLFSHIPVDRLDALAPRLEPRVFQEGQVICNIGDVGTEMYLIVRGHMNVAVVSSEGAGATHQHLGSPTAQSPSSNAAAENGSVESVSGAGSVVGEMSVLFSQKRNCQLIALTTCDVYSMTRDMIVAAVTNQKHMTLLLQKAHSIQAQRQKHAKGRFAEFISQIPLCKEVASADMNAALLEGFTSKVYPPHSTVVTVSEVADRIVIIVRGRARLTANSRDMAVGECVGFTCLIPHRWCYHVVALDTVETIELGCDDFLAIAKAHGVFKELKQLTLGLLYPRVYPDDFQRAFNYVKHLPGPPSFPSSNGYEVKPFAARVTDKASLPYNALKRRPRTDAGLYIAPDEEASQFVPPPQKLSAALPDDEDDAARRRKSTAPSSNAERDDDDDGDLADAPRGDASTSHNRRQSVSAHTTKPAAGNAVSAAKSQREAAKARDAQVLADRKQRSRQEEIDRLAAKIQELHRKGVSMAGSPARSTRRNQQQQQPRKAADADAAETATPAELAEKKESRTVAVQTAKSYLMTRFKMRQSQQGSAVDDSAASSPEKKQPDNCGHEAVATETDAVKDVAVDDDKATDDKADDSKADDKADHVADDKADDKADGNAGNDNGDAKATDDSKIAESPAAKDDADEPAASNADAGTTEPPAGDADDAAKPTEDDDGPKSEVGPSDGDAQSSAAPNGDAKADAASPGDNADGGSEKDAGANQKEEPTSTEAPSTTDGAQPASEPAADAHHATSAPDAAAAVADNDSA